MALSDRDKKLLNDIFSASLKSSNRVNRARFRADNAQFIPELDQLERAGYLEHTDDLYYINISALAYLAKENARAKILVQKCGFVFTLLQASYRENLEKQILLPEIERATGLSADDVELALRFIRQASILGTYSKVFVKPSENILKYKSFEDILKGKDEWDKRRYKQSPRSSELLHTHTEYQVGQKTSLSATSSKATWKAIETEFDITKMGFGRRINFIADPFKRTIIFRDVEQAFVLASLVFSKSAVILAGSVIEELLRLYLQYKQIKPIKRSFEGYIKTCEQEGLLEVGISRLSDSARHFRNVVHLSKEKTKRHTISKAKAKNAVASVFTIVYDF